MTAKATKLGRNRSGRQDGGKLVKLYSAVSDPRELDPHRECGWRCVDRMENAEWPALAREARWRKLAAGKTTGYELQRFDTFSGERTAKTMRIFCRPRFWRV